MTTARNTGMSTSNPKDVCVRSVSKNGPLQH